ncbi:hypothetical protein V5F53_01155 [Xanthobacter sp. V4C-4]|uniref:hypothetical protein n=1 Tax=Xanthobacter cornucopiae TaxID=3119924 RepID=UPI003726C7DA
MNATDSLLIPLTDAGCLSGLKHGALGSRYRFWRDRDGMRHVFSVYAADAAPEYPDAVAIVARRTPAGSIAMWVGRSGEEARRMAERLDAEEIHIHVLGEAPAPSLLRLLGEPVPVARSMEVRCRLPAARPVAANANRHAA